MNVYIVTAQGSYGEWYEIVSVHADKDAADEARVAYARDLADGYVVIVEHEVEGSENPVPTPRQMAEPCLVSGHDWDDKNVPRKATMEDYLRPSTCTRCGTVRQRDSKGGATYTWQPDGPDLRESGYLNP